MINIILVINHFGCENSINVTTLSEVARRMLRRKQSGPILEWQASCTWHRQRVTPLLCEGLTCLWTFVFKWHVTCHFGVKAA